MSRTRQIMAALKERLAGAAAMPPPPPMPVIPAPPVRVYVPQHVPAPHAREVARHTTALLGIGHVGTRYATDVVLQFQAELAVAHEAVATVLDDDWADKLGLVPVKSRVTDHREFLLRPDLGRRLDEPSRARIAERCVRNPDVQIIVADGLSAVAARDTGLALCDALKRACEARGLTVGTPVGAKFARVWLEDEIGELVGAKVAAILLGERPGLGTGDGLSAYLVFGPKVGKTDGDRNMMSNIHPRGTPVEIAAPRLAALAHAMIAQGTSGVTLELGTIEGAIETGYRAPQVRQRLVERGGR